MLYYTTRQCLNIYNVLSSAKMTKMEDSDKYLLIKILRNFKSVCDAYNDYEIDTRRRLKPDNWDEIYEKAQQWKTEGTETTLTEEEKLMVNTCAMTYENSVNSCIEAELSIVNEFDFNKLSESAFEKLIASNNWDVNTCILIHDEFVEVEEKKEDKDTIEYIKM